MLRELFVRHKAFFVELYGRLFGTQKRQLLTFAVTAGVLVLFLSLSGSMTRLFEPPAGRAEMTDLPKMRLNREEYMGPVLQAKLLVSGGRRMLIQAANDRKEGINVAGFERNKKLPTPAMALVMTKKGVVAVPTDDKTPATGGLSYRVMRKIGNEVPPAGKGVPEKDLGVWGNESVMQLSRNYAVADAAPKKGDAVMLTARTSGFDGENLPDVDVKYSVPVPMTDKDLEGKGSCQYFRETGAAADRKCDAASNRHSNIIAGIDNEMAVISGLLGTEPSCCGEGNVSWNSAIARLKSLCAERNQHAALVSKACTSGARSVSCAVYANLGRKAAPPLFCDFKFAVGALALLGGVILVALGLSGAAVPLVSLAGAALLAAGLYASGGNIARIHAPDLVVDTAYTDALRSVAEDNLKKFLSGQSAGSALGSELLEDMQTPPASEVPVNPFK